MHARIPFQARHPFDKMFSEALSNLIKQQPPLPVQYLIDFVSFGPEKAVQVRAPLMCSVDVFQHEHAMKQFSFVTLEPTRLQSTLAKLREIVDDSPMCDNHWDGGVLYYLCRFHVQCVHYSPCQTHQVTEQVAQSSNKKDIGRRD